MEVFCINHPDRKAWGFCHFCREYYCEECLVRGNEYYYCKNVGCIQSHRVEQGLNYDVNLKNEFIIIGIDFGTTKTIAAIYRNNRFEIIPDSKGRLTIPSLVLVTPDDEIFVGWEANLHPNRYGSKHITINSIKRVLGKKQNCTWGNWQTQPQEIAALILARLKVEVEVYLGEEVNDVIISVPAHFDINQRLAVRQAAEIAGFKVRRLINEATATAIFYSHKLSNMGSAIVVDIGGGTTDVSIINYGDGVIEVIGTAGDHYLGGDDFDDVIIGYIKAFLKKKYNNSFTFTTIQEFVLKKAATYAKIELSNSFSTRIYLPAFLKKEGKVYDDLDITINRDAFNLLINPFLQKILSLIDDVLNNIELTFKITSLILVGGSSRIPKIREIVSERIGLSPSGIADAENCVAKGTAAQAAILNGNLKDFLLLDTIQIPILVQDHNGNCEVFIKKNTTIPTYVSKLFTTTNDNQNEMNFRFFEGENTNPSDNIFLGELRINDLPKAPKGVSKVELVVDINANGIIHATVKDKAIRNKESNTTLSAPTNLNQAQINVMQNAVQQIMKSKR